MNKKKGLMLHKESKKYIKSSDKNCINNKISLTLSLFL